MKPSSLKLASVVVLTLLYNYFFWNEKLGINLFIFSGLLIGALWYFYKESFQTKSVLTSLAFTMVAAVMVVWHNSLTSRLAHITSLLILTGLVHVREYRTVYNALAGYVVNLFQVIPNYFSGVQAWVAQSNVGQSRTGRSLAKLRFSFVPLVFFGIFFTIFKFANPVFSDLSDTFFSSIATIFERFFTEFSFARCLFFLSGLYLIGSVLYYKPFRKIIEREARKSDWLTRQRRLVKNKRHVRIPTLGLKNEYTTALLLIGLVNALLLVVNCVDVYWLWFTFDYAQIDNFSTLVHEGTYMLILSILLSMGILLFYFRRNLNFYSQNKLLVRAAYVWIIQNCILGFSVLLRCYYYFHTHGLAYKRIGVVVFLILMYIGLYTLYLKISKKKSFFYLLRVNSWAAYSMFILLALVNWDAFIVSYNIQHPNVKMGIDLEFLLTRSDKTLPIIDRHKSLIANELENQVMYDDRYRYNNSTKKEYLNDRIRQFVADYPKYSWLSWNYADYQAYHYFTDKR